MTHTLYFNFKGSRNYVHGSDIFDAVEALFIPIGWHVVGLTFRHFSRQHLCCVTEDPGGSAMTEGVYQDADGIRAAFWLVETGEPVTERYPFDEEAITAGACIEGDAIQAEGLEGYSVIEQVIVLTKALNYARSPSVNGKWLFGQLRLNQPLPAYATSYRIRQKALLANRFSTQEIVLDGNRYGEIRFVSGTP